MTKRHASFILLCICIAAPAHAAMEYMDTVMAAVRASATASALVHFGRVFVGNDDFVCGDVFLPDSRGATAGAQQFIGSFSTAPIPALNDGMRGRMSFMEVAGGRVALIFANQWSDRPHLFAKMWKQYCGAAMPNAEFAPDRTGRLIEISFERRTLEIAPVPNEQGRAVDTSSHKKAAKSKLS